MEKSRSIQCVRIGTVASDPECHTRMLWTLHRHAAMASPLYACGPLMVLGPIVHGYEGNALCGVFP